jgi:hypothetical protein
MHLRSFNEILVGGSNKVKHASPQEQNQPLSKKTNPT